VWAYRLQRDPDPEEPEAPRVEPGVPNGRFLVAPVVDWAIPPLPAGRWKRSVPVRPRRLTRSPGCGSVTPRGPVEIATPVIPVPWATRSAWTTGSVRVEVPGTTGPVRVEVPGTTGSARTTGSVRVEVPGSARATRTARAMSARSARAVVLGTARRARARSARPRSRRVMGSARRQWWRCWSGIRRTGAHAQHRCAKSTSDGSPRNQLLQFHGPSPIFSEILEFPLRPQTLDSLPMSSL
jgi:hypothetical protein